jgi:hypothetical protein
MIFTHIIGILWGIDCARRRQSDGNHPARFAARVQNAAPQCGIYSHRYPDLGARYRREYCHFQRCRKRALAASPVPEPFQASSGLEYLSAAASAGPEFPRRFSGFPRAVAELLKNGCVCGPFERLESDRRGRAGAIGNAVHDIRLTSDLGHQAGCGARFHIRRGPPGCTLHRPDQLSALAAAVRFESGGCGADLDT